MIARRDLLMGSACVLAAGAAYALKPRRLVSLLAPGQHLNSIVPRTFKDWTSREIGDLFAPRDDDSLASKLYEETVGRAYQQESTQSEVVMLMAHGKAQTEDLQVHRPEVCYPAFGFEIVSDSAFQLAISHQIFLPARRLVAKSADRQETIVYWTRLGEFFPESIQEQRLDRLAAAFQGYIADGLLARFSVAGADTALALKVMDDFIRALIVAVPRGERGALIGSERSQELERRGA